MCKQPTFHFLAQMYYMETISWPGNISIKVLLAKIAFLFCSILFCYLFNTPTFCINSISDIVFLFCRYAGVLLFCFSVIFQLFPQCSGVMLVIYCSVSIPPLIWCSPSVPRSVGPCSIVPVFVVWEYTFVLYW